MPVKRFRLFRDWVQSHDEERPPLTKFGMWAFISFMALVVAAAVWIGATLAGQSAGRAAFAEAQKVSARQLARGCGRNQIQRGYLKLRSHEVHSATAAEADALFQVVWCEKTYAPNYSGPTIYLPAGSESCFLSLLKRGYWNDREPYTDPAKLTGVCSRLGLVT